MESPAQPKAERLRIQPCGLGRRQCSQCVVLTPEGPTVNGQGLARCQRELPTLPTHPMVGQPILRQCPLTLVDGIETRDRVVSLQLSDHQPCGLRVPLFDHSEGSAQLAQCAAARTRTNRPLTMTGWKRHALPLKHVECPRSRGGTPRRSRHGVWQNLLCLATRSLPLWCHTWRRGETHWVSLTQGMRWKSTCCCLVLCSRNSCTYSFFPWGMPRTFTPCWAAGSKRSPRQNNNFKFQHSCSPGRRFSALANSFEHGECQSWAHWTHSEALERRLLARSMN